MSREQDAARVERSMLDRAEDRWFVDRQLRTRALLLGGGSAFLVLFTVAILVLPFTYTLVAPLMVIAGVFLLANPRESLVMVLGARIIVDLLWWAPELAGIRLTEAYSGSVFALAILLLVVHEERVQRHFFFVPALLFGVPVLVGTLQDLSYLGIGMRTNVEFVARMLSPVILMMLVSVLLDSDRLRKAMIYVVPFVAVVPLIAAVYHYLDGQMNVVIFEGYGRLRGGYANLHNHAHAVGLFAALGVFLIATAKTPLRRLAAVGFTAWAAWAMFLTYVRTTQLGVLVLIGTMLALRGKWRHMILAAAIGLPLAAQTEVFQDRYGGLVEAAAEGPTYGTDVNTLGSGRIGMWTEGMQDYRSRPFLELMFGKGSKGAHRTHLTRESVDTHNDYLNLLLSTGVVGLAVYLYFQGVLAWIALSVRRRTDDPWWTTFAEWMLGMNGLVFVTNFLSNSYVSRFTFGMVFWMLAGVLIAKHAELTGSFGLPPREGGPKPLSHRSPREQLQGPRFGPGPQLPPPR